MCDESSRNGKVHASIRKIWLVTVLVSVSLGMLISDGAMAAGPVIVELTQTPCKIVEVENNHREYVSGSYDDCARINKETAGERSFKVLRLKQGKTIFRVTNRNVPYDLGFWVRGKGVKRLSLPSVSGGGLSTGMTKDYEVDLKPGEYLYSCPLNPTPDYPLVVE